MTHLKREFTHRRLKIKLDSTSSILIKTSTTVLLLPLVTKFRYKRLDEMVFISTGKLEVDRQRTKNKELVKF